MFRLLTAAALLTCCWGSPFREGKIVGGGDADITEYPYQLQLALYGQHSCGASVISEDWAITAAHCVQKIRTDAITLRAGSTIRDHGGVVHTVEESIVHRRYEDLDYDIALLKVSEPFKLSDSVKAIALPVLHQRLLGGVDAEVSGWGYLRAGSGHPSNVLQHVDVPIVTQESCGAAYDEDYKAITDRMICAGVPAGGKDACQGDSGGPLAVNGTLEGIVSWGNGCAMPGFPGVYTRVAEFRDWIKEYSGV